MRQIGEIVEEVLASLPEEDQDRIAQHVAIRVKDRPDPEDLERGANDAHEGYFYGTPLPTDDEEREDPLWDEDPQGGEVVIFTGQIKPFTEERIRTVLLHELNHFLGYDEDDLVAGLGLG